MWIGSYRVAPILIGVALLVLVGAGVAGYLLVGGDQASDQAPTASSPAEAQTSTRVGPTAGAGTASATTTPGAPSRPASAPPVGHPPGTFAVRAQARLRRCTGGRCQAGPAPLMLVEITPSSGGVTTDVETDSTGRFAVYLKPGRYRLQVIGDRRRTVARGSVVVSAGASKVQLTPTG